MWAVLLAGRLRVTPLPDVARQLGVAPKTLYNLLSAFRAQFLEPTYGGMAGDGRVRLLSHAEVARLRQLIRETAPPFRVARTS